MWQWDGDKCHKFACWNGTNTQRWILSVKVDKWRASSNTDRSNEMAEAWPHLTWQKKKKHEHLANADKPRQSNSRPTLHHLVYSESFIKRAYNTFSSWALTTKWIMRRKKESAAQKKESVKWERPNDKMLGSEFSCSPNPELNSCVHGKDDVRCIYSRTVFE